MAREQYEIRWKDYYEILQVHTKAEPEVITAAYRRLALMYHPDKNSSAEAGNRFKEINEANEVLSDPERRETYDFVYKRVQAGQNAQGSYDSSYEEGPRQSDETKRSYGNDQSYSTGSSWYDEEAEWESQPQSQYSYEARPDSIFSFAFFKYLINNLVDRLAPNPVESQRILPWPSWKWQRVWLLAASPLAAVSFLFALTNGTWGAMLFSAIFLAASIYSGKMTGWLRETSEASRPARIAGGAAITLSGISWSLGVAYGVLAIIMAIFFIRLMGIMLMAMLEEALNRYR